MIICAALSPLTNSLFLCETWPRTERPAPLLWPAQDCVRAQPALQFSGYGLQAKGTRIREQLHPCWHSGCCTDTNVPTWGNQTKTLLPALKSLLPGNETRRPDKMEEIHLRGSLIKIIFLCMLCLRVLFSGIAQAVLSLDLHKNLLWQWELNCTQSCQQCLHILIAKSNLSNQIKSNTSDGGSVKFKLKSVCGSSCAECKWILLYVNAISVWRPLTTLASKWVVCCCFLLTSSSQQGQHSRTVTQMISQ